MTFSSFRRLYALVGVCLFAACSFDPSVVPPGYGDDAAVNGAVDDVANSGDASGSDDASGASDGGPTVSDVSPPGPDASPPDMSVADMPQDRGGEGPDMMSPDASIPDMPPGVCDGMMVDLDTDPQHCGECDNACDTDHGVCSGGTCQCEHGAMACGPENECSDLAHDPNNCGMCGRGCAVGEVCVGGDCLCRSGLMLCGGACVDTQTDPSHCGDCDIDCGGKICLDGVCENRNNCPLGTWPCDKPGGKACVRGQENDFFCDPKLTDTCGTECSGDEVCFDPGIFAGPECVTYRPGLGCSGCPCTDCVGNEACLEDPDVPGVAYCLSR